MSDDTIWRVTDPQDPADETGTDTAARTPSYLRSATARRAAAAFRSLQGTSGDVDVQLWTTAGGTPIRHRLTQRFDAAGDLLHTYPGTVA